MLELTLKHVKAINNLLEQQQQKIISLQNGMQIGEFSIMQKEWHTKSVAPLNFSPPLPIRLFLSAFQNKEIETRLRNAANDLAYRTVVKENIDMVSNPYGLIAGEQGNGHSENSEEMFRSGFHLCAKEVLQFLANQETVCDLAPTHIINHLQKVASEFIQSPPSPRLEEPTLKAPETREKPASPQPKAAEGHAKNCVPVIQRTYPHSSEQSGSDTDTDSGYGGELEKRELKAQRSVYYGKDAGDLKHSGNIKEELDEPQAKRQRSDSSEDESLSGPDIVGSHSPYMSFSPHQPLCMPFYLFPHGAAAAYLPMLEKCWYPGAMPVLYQGLGGSPASMSPEKLSSSLIMSSRVGSPVTPTSMDSPALLQALKQVPPLNLETKDWGLTLGSAIARSLNVLVLRVDFPAE